MSAMVPSPNDRSAAAPRGEVHSLSYSRYAGPRRPRSAVPWVVARYAWRVQLRQRGVKVLLLLGGGVLAISGAVLGFAWSVPGMTGGGEADPVRAAEAQAIASSLEAQFIPGFLLVLWCGAGAVAADLNAGAFQFHFARPVSAQGYLVGRVLSGAGLAFALSFATLAVLCAERLAFGSTPLRMALTFAVGAALVTARATLLGVVAAGLSSLTRRKGLAQAMFAAVVFASSFVTRIVAAASDKPWVRALGLSGCVDALAAQWRGTAGLHGALAAVPLLACIGWGVAGAALAWWRVSRAEVMRG